MRYKSFEQVTVRVAYFSFIGTSGRQKETIDDGNKDVTNCTISKRSHLLNWKRGCEAVSVKDLR